jgi:hypothetical protein
MSDATIRFMIEVDPAGQVKSVKAVGALGDEAEKQGKRFGKGVEGSFGRMMDSWGKFVAAGAVAARVWNGVADVIRTASQAATARVAEWERKNGAARGERFAAATAAANLRVLGVSDKGISDIQGKLGGISPLFQSQARADFGGIAAQLARRKDLSGGQYEDALRAAVDGLSRRGHLAGFGAAYETLAGATGVAPGANLTDLATGLLMRGSRLGEGQEKALREGIAGGSVRIDASGMLAGIGADLSDALREAVAGVNRAGGLSVGPRSAGGFISYGGNYSQITATTAGRDSGLDFSDPGNPEGARPGGDPTAGDYAGAMVNNPVVQAAVAAAVIKGADMLLSKGGAAAGAAGAAGAGASRAGSFLARFGPAGLLAVAAGNLALSTGQAIYDRTAEDGDLNPDNPRYKGPIKLAPGEDAGRRIRGHNIRDATDVRGKLADDQVVPLLSRIATGIDRLASTPASPTPAAP